MMDSPAHSTAETTAIQITPDHSLRVSCYCEENAWRVVYSHLHDIQRSKSNSQESNSNSRQEWNNDDYYVVFVSNEQRCCPFFQQRACAKPDDYVCWDYHVIIFRSKKTTTNHDEQIQHQQQSSATSTKTEVLDIDTWLPYPCPIQQYLDESFPHTHNPNLDPKYLPSFRVISAASYLKYFYSDRSHMFKNGKWLAEPPEYEPIMNGLSLDDDSGGRKSNLDDYINLQSDGEVQSESKNRMGTVFSLEQLRERFD